jgi:small subunit ribosomal protein S13
MARISGVNLPNDKRIEVALTYIFGIGPANSKKILEVTGIDANTRTKDLSEAEIAKIRDYIDKSFQVEGDLSRLISLNIKRLKDINAYRGLRHKNNLPVHGQRTKTNARTKRGKRMTMGSGRKKSAAKT